MLTIGLTGGIASGKTTVANDFAALGISQIDADVIARDVVAPGEPLLEEIAQHFGHSILTADGALDRQQLRRLIFEDTDQRHWLESRMHPAIFTRIQALLPTLNGPYRLLTVPLLLESNKYQSIVDRVLVVDIPESMQLERLMARDGSSLEQAQAILKAQMPRKERLSQADDVIDNTQSTAVTSQRVKALDAMYHSLAAQHH